MGDLGCAGLVDPARSAVSRPSAPPPEAAASGRIADMGANWREPRAVAVWAPLVLALISVAVDRVSGRWLEWPASLHLRNNVIAANFFIAVLTSATAGFLSRDRAEGRIAAMLGFGLYGFAAYLCVMAVSVQWME